MAPDMSRASREVLEELAFAVLTDQGGPHGVALKDEAIAKLRAETAPLRTLAERNALIAETMEEYFAERHSQAWIGLERVRKLLEEPMREPYQIGMELIGPNWQVVTWRDSVTELATDLLSLLNPEQVRELSRMLVPKIELDTLDAKVLSLKRVINRAIQFLPSDSAVCKACVEAIRD